MSAYTCGTTMYMSSTQKRSWTFSNESELNTLRTEANAQYIERHREDEAAVKAGDPSRFFLTAAEERCLVRQFELHLRDFCRRFQPPIPRAVMGAAFHYFKRFYLRNSAMDYHPKEMLVTCVYLATKVEEFNVSMAQFVSNIKGDREKAAEIILNNELLLMLHLNYNLTVHHPFRPVEGLLVDIKSRGSLRDPERLRPGIEEMLERVYLTDAILLYSPSQIALAAILHAASKINENLDSYVMEILIGPSGREHLSGLIEAVRCIRSLIKCIELPPKDQMRLLDKKLEKCRNQAHNPDSYVYKKRMLDMIDEDDDDDERYLYTKMIRDQSANDEALLGVSKVHSPAA